MMQNLQQERLGGGGADNCEGFQKAQTECFREGGLHGGIGAVIIPRPAGTDPALAAFASLLGRAILGGDGQRGERLILVFRHESADGRQCGVG